MLCGRALSSSCWALVEAIPSFWGRLLACFPEEGAPVLRDALLACLEGLTGLSFEENIWLVKQCVYRERIRIIQEEVKQSSHKELVQCSEKEIRVKTEIAHVGDLCVNIRSEKPSLFTSTSGISQVDLRVGLACSNCPIEQI